MKTQEQQRRAIAERDANQRAADAGAPLPYPNIWDRLDPTKIPADAPADALQASHAAFRAFCRPQPRRTLSLKP